jgi:hypothetical protein
VKKTLLSPVTSLLVSLSIALGILVCNMTDYGLLTTAHACGSDGSSVTVLGESWTLDHALAPDGVAFQSIVVNGQILEAGVIASPVNFVSGSVVNAQGVLVGNEVGGVQPPGTSSNGVLVGNETPCMDGVLVGNEGQISGSSTDPKGVLVGNEVNVTGVIVDSSGTASGGILTGDNISISNGVLTGQNLVLSGATLSGGVISMSGAITEVSTSPGE